MTTKQGQGYVTAQFPQKRINYKNSQKTGDEIKERAVNKIYKFWLKTFTNIAHIFLYTFHE